MTKDQAAAIVSAIDMLIEAKIFDHEHPEWGPRATSLLENLTEALMEVSDDNAGA